MTNNREKQLRRLWELQSTPREIVQAHADRIERIATAGIKLPEEEWDALFKSWAFIWTARASDILAKVVKARARLNKLQSV